MYKELMEDPWLLGPDAQFFSACAGNGYLTAVHPIIPL